MAKKVVEVQAKVDNGLACNENGGDDALFSLVGRNKGGRSLYSGCTMAGGS